jgi:hypothetical protein
MVSALLMLGLAFVTVRAQDSEAKAAPRGGSAKGADGDNAYQGQLLGRDSGP